MSIQGRVCFYSTEPQLLHRPPIGQLIDAFRCTKAWLVMRTNSVERGWAELCRSLGRPEDVDWEPSSNKVYTRVDDPALFEWEQMGYLIPVTGIPSMFIEPRCLQADLDWEAGSALDLVLRREIPEAIHGGFVAAGLGFRAGGHDLCESMEHYYGHFIARASFTVYFMGHGCPNDSPAYLERYLAVEQIRNVRAGIESLIGPTEVCMLFE